MYYPILYFIINKLEECVDEDKIPEHDSPTQIARELVNIIDFTHCTNNQYMNFAYNGPVETVQCSNPIVRGRSIKKMPYETVAAYMGKTERVCSNLHQAL